LNKIIRITLSPEAEEVYNYLNKEVAEVEKSGKKRRIQSKAGQPPRNK